MDGDVELTGAMQGRDVRSNRMVTKDVSGVLTHLLPAAVNPSWKHDQELHQRGSDHALLVVDAAARTAATACANAS